MAQALRVEIIGDASSYARALDKASGATTSFGRTLGKVAKVSALAFGAAGIGGAIFTLKRGFEEISSAQKVAAQTAAVLESTGHAANVTAGQIHELAQETLLKTGIDDEAIQAGENMLLTFRNVRNEVGKGNDIFTQATKAGLDMSTAMQGAGFEGGNLKTTMIRLGKALNDPVTGMTALRRVGVTFTKDQQKTIKQLESTGHHLEAQKLILAELNKEFGGSAEAFGKTMPGQLAIAQESFNNLAGEIATRLLPVVNQVLAWVNTHWPEISATFNAVADGVTAAIAGIRTAVEAIIPIVQAVVTWFQQNWPRIAETATRGWNAVAPIIIGVFDAIRTAVQLAVRVIEALWSQFGDTIIAQTRVVWSYIGGTVKNALEVIRGIVNVVGGLLHGDFGRVWEGIKQIFGGQIAQIKNIFNTFLGTLVNVARGWLTALGAVFTAAVGTIGSAAADIGHAIIKGITSGLSGIYAAVKGGLDVIWRAISTVARLAYNAAKAIPGEIVGGIVDGFKALTGKVTGAVQDHVLHPIGKALHDIPGFSPPVDAGRWLGTELVRGITESLKQGQAGVTTATTNLTKGIGKGLGNAAGAIIAAARKVGVDARAALAVAMTEGGTSFGAVGDKGTSFGPFQLHIGGANPFSDPAKAASFANSIKGITYALQQMASAGAAGKSGFDAISSIVRSFERPANPAAEVAKALAYYKQIPAQLGEGLTQAGAATSAATVRMLGQIAVLVRNAGRVIGLDHARQVVAGLVEGTPSIVEQARQALQQAMAAARQAVTDAKASFQSAFSSLAQSALSSFDAAMAKWKPPSQILLDKMQLEDQINQAVKGVADAQAAVDAAVATRDTLTRNEGESDADFAARQAQAEADIKTAVENLGAAQRSYTETQLALAAAQEQRAHDEKAGRDREHLAEDLLRLQTWLSKHPEEYDKVQGKILKLLKSYEGPLFDAAETLGGAFRDGLAAGIAGVVDDLRRLANAIESGKAAGGGGGVPVNPGTAIGGGHGAGVPTGRGTVTNNVTVNMPNYLGDARSAAQEIRRELQQLGQNNANNPMAAF